MAEQNKVPFVPQDVQETTTLLRNLELHTKTQKIGGKKSFSCKKTSFSLADSSEGLSVDSWRFQDWDYKRDDLPVYARGLFTTKNEKGHPEIAIRGYDKFFNIGEVVRTKWEEIESETKGPYELSLKENGCIIFISGLWDGTLLVCSKHSTGERSDTELSHAMAGQKWIERQLKALGKSKQELAMELRRRNATAVAELCDDGFEEHILAYRDDEAGLYLHGININVPEHVTYPGTQVQAFADEWGFKKTQFLIHETIQSTRGFLESIAETGSYNGRDVEGFVIRCQARQGGRGPYQDWFFKYKFEEPYLMYRQWRECTKAIIAGRQPKYRKHVKITEEYLLYAKKRMAKDSRLAKEYNQNHGIIGLRDDFLKEKNLKGSDIIRQEYADMGGAPQDADRDIILVPIATIGCGKTTIAVALQHLFNWGHVQNDNIMGKGRPPRFVREVLTLLQDHPVVIADRNNAQRHERKQLLDDVHAQLLGAKLVALHFVHTRGSIDAIRRVTQDRVFSRGDNHQTIQAKSERNKVVGIMEGFIHRFEDLNVAAGPDDGFDAAIDLDPAVGSRENLETVVGQLHEIFPRLVAEMPTGEELDEAIAFALNEYRPDIKHVIGERGPKAGKGRKNDKSDKFASAAVSNAKKRPLEYMSVALPKTELINVVESTVGKLPPPEARFYRQLQQTRRVQPEFHVTLIHRASANAHRALWDRYAEMHAEAGGAENKLGDCRVLLERVVWDDRLMTIVARLVDEGWECVNLVAHVTVGTKSPEVKPVESNDLLKRWLEIGSGGETGIHEAIISDRTVLHGTVKGVLGR